MKRFALLLALAGSLSTFAQSDESTIIKRDYIDAENLKYITELNTYLNGLGCTAYADSLEMIIAKGAGTTSAYKKKDAEPIVLRAVETAKQYLAVKSETPTTFADEATDGAYYLYNVGTKEWLASIDGQTVIDQPGDQFTVAGGKIGEWTVTPANKGTFAIMDGDKALGYTVGTRNLVEAKAEADEWMLVSTAVRNAAITAATAEAPVDASFLIANPGFNAGAEAWTGAEGNVGGYEDKYVTTTGTISQEISGLKAGTYKVLVQACGAGTLTANGAEVAIKAAASETAPLWVGDDWGHNVAAPDVLFQAGMYWNEVTAEVAADGKLTIAVNATAETNVDNFRLVAIEVKDTPEGKLGDVNEDGYVTIADIITVQNYMAEGETAETKPLADVNKDGFITIADIITIQNIMAQ